MKLKGTISVKHVRDGKIIAEETVQNTITNVGLGKVAGLINGQVTNTYKYLAVGDSSTAAAAGDTTLASEITAPTSIDRVIANTVTQITTAQTDDTAQLVVTFTNNSSTTVSVQEAGMFDTSTENGGNMLGRQSFTAKSMEENDTLQIQYNIQVQ